MEKKSINLFNLIDQLGHVAENQTADMKISVGPKKIEVYKGKEENTVMTIAVEDNTDYLIGDKVVEKNKLYQFKASKSGITELTESQLVKKRAVSVEKRGYGCGPGGLNAYLNM